MRNYPRRAPGRRGPPPEGIPLKQRRERTPRAPSTRTARAPRAPSDPVVCHLSSRFEEADYLQRQAETTRSTSEALGFAPVFGVSGWVVSGPSEPLPSGYARASTLAQAGFPVVSTPHLGRRGHVTILLSDPVHENQAARFNEAFGRCG